MQRREPKASERERSNPRLRQNYAMVETALEQVVTAACDGADPGIAGALRYAVGTGRKRLRPQLVLATALALGGEATHVVDAACAMELLHCASLVLDDLPAMDNASLRHGRATAHLEFGEPIAILVTHAMLAEAIRLIAANCSEIGLSAQETASIVTLVTRLVGPRGMIGGQTLDLSPTTPDQPQEVLENVCRLKTASLFRACVQVAGLLYRASEDILEGLDLFAERFGLAFQIRDDILDVVATEETIGKNIGQDRRGATLVHRLGIDGARLRARSLELDALTGLGGIDLDKEPLSAFVTQVVGEG